MAAKAGSRARIAVTGDRALDRKLRALGPKVANRVVRRALREGGKVFQAELRQNAPEGETRELKREIRVRALKAKGRRKGAIGIQAAVIPISEDQDKYYSAFPEWGTVDQPPQGYARRSFDSQKSQVRRLVMDAIRRGVEREASS